MTFFPYKTKLVLGEGPRHNMFKISGHNLVTYLNEPHKFEQVLLIVDLRTHIDR